MCLPTLSWGDALKEKNVMSLLAINRPGSKGPFNYNVGIHVDFERELDYKMTIIAP